MARFLFGFPQKIVEFLHAPARLMSISQRLLFDPLAQRWYVNRGQDFVAVDDPSSVDLLMSTLPLVILEERQRTRIAGGSALVREMSGAMRIMFRGPGGEDLPSVDIPISDSLLLQVDWLRGGHTDGWVDVRAHLQIHGSSAVAFSFYLPALEGAAAKTVELRVDGTLVAQVSVPRGELVRTAEFTVSHRGSDVLVTADYAEPSSAEDRRGERGVNARVLVEGAEAPAFVL